VKTTTEKLTSWFDGIDNPMFAYNNPEGLTVVRGTKTTYRSDGEDCRALGNLYSDPVWTSDGPLRKARFGECGRYDTRPSLQPCRRKRRLRRPAGQPGRRCCFRVCQRDVKVLQRFDQPVGVTAAGGRSTASGPQFVFGTIDVQGDCGHPGPVWLTDQTGNHKMKTDTSAIAKGGEVFLGDVWMSPQGQIMATLSSSICNPSGGTIATPASLWRLDGQKWVSVDRGPLAYVRQLPDSDKAVVTSGDLYVERNGKGTRIAREVYAIAVPPPWRCR
jgi:hypothetical protein